MPKPRVAILHYSTPPVIGGVEFIIEAHARQLAEHGYWVKIVTGKGETFDSRIPVKIIPEADSLDPRNQRINTQLARGEVSEAFEQLAEKIHKSLIENLADIDVCIIHNILTMHFNLPLTAALCEYIEGQTERKKFISWCHDIAHRDPDYRGKLREDFPWSLIRKQVCGVKYVAISKQRQGALASLFEVSPDQIRVVPDGIDYKSFLNLDPVVWKLFKELKLFDFDLVMLFPTRILRRKNIELAVKITRALNAREMKSALLVTGPPNPHDIDSMRYYRKVGDLVDKLGLSGRVIFLAKLKDNHGKEMRIGLGMLRSLYLFCDVLLFPSLREGFGVPLLEAGLAKLPIVCSDIGTLREVGGNDVCYIDPEADPENLAKKIIEFYNRLEAIPMFKKIIRNYTWEAIFSRHIEPLLMQGTGDRVQGTGKN